MPNLPYIDPELVKVYQREVAQTASPATSKRKISSLNRFFDWAQSEGHINQNPLRPITITPPPKKGLVSVSNFLKLGMLGGLVVLIFLIGKNVRLPIPFNLTPAGEFGGPGPAASPVASPKVSISTPVPSISQEVDPIFSRIYKDGVLTLEGLAPALKAIGGLLIEGKTITLSTSTGSDGDITINPDGAGITHFLFEGNKGNFLTAEAPNLTSGSLFYGIVANNATGYNLIKLQSGSNPITRFSVDASGNTAIGGNLNVSKDIQTSSVSRLTSAGALTNITGYTQTSGNFSITQGAGDAATITKTASALSDLLTLTLDERGKANSIYSTLKLRRYNGAAEAMALLVDVGNAQFNGQLELGRFSSNPTSIGQGSLVFNTSDTTAYLWNGSAWTALGGGSVSGFWQRNGTAVSPATITDTVGIGTTTTAATALLDLTSTAKGFLGPRMTTTQRDAITSPATGLMIYNTTTNAYNVFNGTSWGVLGGGSTSWSGLTDPTTNLSLNNMAAWTTTFTWNAATSTSNLFTMQDTASNTGTGYLLNLATATGSTLKPFHVSSAGTEAITVLANGNVGIRNTSPGQELDIGGDAAITFGNFLWFNGPSDGAWRIGGTNSAGALSGSSLVTNNRQNIVFSTGATDGLVIGPNGLNSAMEINGSGTVYFRNNVGIGTTAPNAPLQVGTGTNTHTLGAGDAFVTSDIELDGVLYLDGGNISNSVGTATMQLCIDAACSSTSQLRHTLTNGSWLVQNPVAGNVGKAALAVDQDMVNQDIFTASASGTPKVTIAYSGNVGIGVTNPGTALSVNGIISGPSTQNLRLQATGATAGNGSNGSIYFLDSSSNTKGRIDTTFDASFGNGADGNINVTSSVNINTTIIASGRAYADGIAYRVNAPAASATSVTRFSSSDILSNGISAGEEVLIINMEGASGDTADVGNYEFRTVQSITASTITFTSALTKTYAGITAGNQKVIVQRVPHYKDVLLSGAGSITASAWDGLATTPAGVAGYLTGIVAFRSNGTVSVNTGTSITVAGKGYRAGAIGTGNNINGNCPTCNAAGGESRPGTGSVSTSANDGGGGGGGGNDNGGKFAAGGGGAGYGAAGSSGSGGTSPGTGGGSYGAAALTTLFHGSGGGGGGSDWPSGNSGGTGGIGGGIIFIAGSTITVTSTGVISANGNNGGNGSGVNNNGGGGGGSGGSIFLVSGTPTLGTNLVTATAGSGGAATGSGGTGGAGGVGRIRVEYTGTLSGTTNPAASTQASISSNAQVVGSPYGTLYIGAVNLSSSDLAEYYVAGSNDISPGDVVSISDTEIVGSGGSSVANSGVLRKATTPYDFKLIGVISTNPGVVLGSIDGKTGQIDNRAVALSGRVPVKIAPDSPPILIGDFLTSSGTYPGMAMKAIKAGYTVAKALEAWAPGGPELVEGFVNLGYYDPNVSLTDAGNLQIKSITSSTGSISTTPSLSASPEASPSGEITTIQPTPLPTPLPSPKPVFTLVRQTTGETINRIGAFADFVAANIKAGAIETRQLTADGLTAFTGTIDNLLITTKLVSPLAEIDEIHTGIISPIPEKKDITVKIGRSRSEVSNNQSGVSEFGKLIVENASGSAVATVDEAGNATFSGTVNSQQLTVNSASVAGELYADKIHSTTLDDIQKLLKQVETDQKLLTQAGSWNVNTASEAGTINYQQLTINNLYVTDKAAISSLSVSSSFMVGTDLAIQSSMNHEPSTINTLSAPLALQSLALAPVEIMAGKFRIETNGDVKILGNLAIAGNLEVKGLTKTKELSTEKLVVAAADQATPSAQISANEIATNATVGKATIPTGISEITIKNPNISDYTLVYVTPTSSTENKVLYVKSKQQGKFVVGFTEPLDIDVSFNWWVIDVSQ